MISSGKSPGVWILYADDWEHSVCSIIFRLWRWNRQSVPKRRHIIFRRRGISHKKAYNIQNTAKVWNQEFVNLSAGSGYNH